MKKTGGRKNAIVETSVLPIVPKSSFTSHSSLPKSSSHVTSKPKTVDTSSTSKRSASAVRAALLYDDSDSSASSDDSDSNDDGNSDSDEFNGTGSIGSILSRRRNIGKRIHPGDDHQQAPVASKKPRTTEIPIPHSMDASNGAQDDDIDEDAGEHGSHVPTHTSAPPARENAATTAGKRPRSNSPPTYSQLHVIEAVTIAPELIPDISRDILTWDEFERNLKKYKDIWPLYLRLHGELSKNRADFETLKTTLNRAESAQQPQQANRIKEELHSLVEQRRSIVDPMRITYSKLHTAMTILRQQLQTFSAKHVPKDSELA